VIVWAFARLGFHPGPLLGCLAERVAPGVPSLCPDAVGRTAWAFATLDHGDRSLITAVVAAAAPRLHMYSAQVQCCYICVSPAHLMKTSPEAGET
jgi:hypothetical protein